MIAKYYGKSFSIEFLRKRTGITKVGVSLAGISEAAESVGFHSIGATIDYNTLVKKVALPCIIHWRQRHFIVVYRIKKNLVFVADPSHGLMKYSKDKFISGWIGSNADNSKGLGSVLILEPTPKFYSGKESSENRYNLSFLLSYFRPYRKQVFQLFLGLIIGSLIQLILPFLTQAIVDQGIRYQELNFIYLILIAQLTLFISQTTVEVVRGWILLHITTRVNIHLISDFLVKLMRLPIAFFDSKNTGDIIQRIHDHRRIQNFLSTTTINTIFSAFNIVIFGWVLWYYSHLIFSIFFLGSMLYIIWALIFMKKRAELDYKRFDESSDNQSSLFQLISGIQEIKLNGSERRRRWEWEAIQVRLFENSMKRLKLSQTQITGGRFLNELKNILITFISAKLVIDGEITLGIMLSVQYIIGQLNLPINNFITFVQNGQDAKISLERLSEIHNEKDEVSPENSTLQIIPEDNTIELKCVNFRYGGKSSPAVLENIDLKIPKGKVTAIVGTSGSGKTTLLKLLLKFYVPNEGEICVGGHDLKKINTNVWRNACGSVMQEGFIFNDTIARNITESDSEGAIDQERLNYAVAAANIKEFIEKQPHGYNTKIGISGMKISGGQKQRILIARAVYKNPDYIFFDEATSALDASNERVIMKNLQEFYKGKTVIIIAHRLSTVKNADQIVVLEKGKIVENGNHTQLVGKKAVYYSLVKNQLELGSN
jgi:ATP-binding cassette subfamily B protein